MHSPVWDYHPSWDTADVWSDWDYYSDDYFDYDSVGDAKQKGSGRALKRKSSGDVCANTKKRRLANTEVTPSLSLNDPSESAYSSACTPDSVVRWKKDTLTQPDGLVLGDADLEPVSLLKDWRDRYNSQTNDRTKRPQRKVASRSQSPRPLSALTHSWERDGLKSQGRSEEFEEPLKSPHVKKDL